MLKVSIPSDLRLPRQYILNVLLSEFLGIPFKTEINDKNNISISYGGKVLILADVFFKSCHWLKPESLPSLPLRQWNVSQDIADVNLTSDFVPVIFANEMYFKAQENEIYLGLDILGSAFFMLARYEEIVKKDQDAHGRFPASASIAYKSGFIDRPIIDEYVEILWAAITMLWPNFKRKKRTPKTLVTCDVDDPYLCYSKSFKKTVRVMVGDLLKRKSPVQAIRNLSRYLYMRKGVFSHDPYQQSLEWIMDVNEAEGNKVSFYFISGGHDSVFDTYYHMNEPLIRKLLRRIHSRGHEIGLHASYGSYKNQAQIIQEFQTLCNVMDEEGILQSEIGNRQHYLRWETPTTSINLDNTGLCYDTTLYYADHPGFRCGTSQEFPMYDWEQCCALKIRQRPLILMEGTIFDKTYMDMGYTQSALEYMKMIKQHCFQFGGNFTLLWHNSYFKTAEDKAFYLELIS